MNEMKPSAGMTGWRFIFLLMIVSSLALLAFDTSGSSIDASLSSGKIASSVSFTNMSGFYR